MMLVNFMQKRVKIDMEYEFLEEYPVSYLCPRVTIKRDRCGGKPCIRGTEITVKKIANLANSGVSQQEVIKKYPELTMEDLRDVYIYYHGPHLMFQNLETPDVCPGETTKVLM